MRPAAKRVGASKAPHRAVSDATHGPLEGYGADVGGNVDTANRREPSEPRGTPDRTRTHEAREGVGRGREGASTQNAGRRATAERSETREGARAYPANRRARAPVTVAASRSRTSMMDAVLQVQGSPGEQEEQVGSREWPHGDSAAAPEQGLEVERNPHKGAHP